jgi:hypothetical protein
LSTISGVSSTPSPRSGAICWLLIRRKPVTTRKSGVTSVANVAHWPEPFRIASSWIVGVPAAIPNRSRSSWLRSPFQTTVSALFAALADSPGVGL